MTAGQRPDVFRTALAIHQMHSVRDPWGCWGFAEVLNLKRKPQRFPINSWSVSYGGYNHSIHGPCREYTVLLLYYYIQRHIIPTDSQFPCRKQLTWTPNVTSIVPQNRQTEGRTRNPKRKGTTDSPTLRINKTSKRLFWKALEPRTSETCKWPTQVIVRMELHSTLISGYPTYVTLLHR